MRAVVQRVTSAVVKVDGVVAGAIDSGLVVLLGVERGDGRAEVNALCDKIALMRLFASDRGHFERAVGDVDGAILLISQFTLQADVRRGRRPSFSRAAPPQEAESLIDAAAERFRWHGIGVETGVFGAMMEVDLINEGPTTIVVETSGGKVV